MNNKIREFNLLKNNLIFKISNSNLDLDLKNFYIQVINDKKIEKSIIKKINKNEKISKAISDTFDIYSQIFINKNLKYYQDLQNLKRYWLNIENNKYFIQDNILICKELSPFEIDSLDRNIIKKIVFTNVGQFSHSVIYAKSLGFDIVTFDVSNFNKNHFMSDKFNFYFNINNINSFKKNNQIGLVRTEFVCVKNNLILSENEQYLIYKNILSNSSNASIRLFDFTEEKASYLKDINKYNGMEFLFNKKETILIPQLKALLKASKYGNLTIILPRVYSIDEIIKFKKIINDINKNINANYSLSLMIENISIINDLDLINDYVDSYNIGTNDLIFSILNEKDRKVTILEKQFKKIFLEKMQEIINKINKPIIVCGNQVNDSKIVNELSKMGYSNFSIDFT